MQAPFLFPGTCGTCGSSGTTGTSGTSGTSGTINFDIYKHGVSR